MSGKKRLIIIALLIPLLVISFLTVVNANGNHMKLLAVTEINETDFVGGIADLYVEIIPGEGRVFIDTYPITKLDTQMSTRIAKEIACDFLDADCSEFDFFYTIRAQSALIGGPSAGGAIALLTITTLDNQNIKSDVSITGTINSGGIIGPVGGLKAKIEAAAGEGLNKVLIPLGEANYEDRSTNETIDLIEYGSELGVEIIEVKDLYDGMKYLTGKDYPINRAKVEVTEQYVKIMKEVAEDICSITEDLKEKVIEAELSENKTEVWNNAMDLHNSSNIEILNKNYYSAASFCFGANTKLKYLELLQDNLSEENIRGLIEHVQGRIDDARMEIALKDINTISDLQTTIISKERVEDSQDTLNDVRDILDIKLNESDYDDLDEKVKEAIVAGIAYSIERLESAIFWTAFYNYKSKKFNLDAEVLYNSCFTKLTEAEQRVVYLQMFYPVELNDMEKSVDEARKSMDNGDYVSCLFKASKVKADSDFFMSATMIDNDTLDGFIEQKRLAAERALVKQQEKGNFPILAHSYYEYGKSLIQDDKASALLYFEYTLELSNLDLYLKNDLNSLKLKNVRDYAILIYIIGGFIIGFIVGAIFFKKQDKNKKVQTKKVIKSSQSSKKSKSNSKSRAKAKKKVKQVKKINKKQNKKASKK